MKKSAKWSAVGLNGPENNKNGKPKHKVPADATDIVAVSLSIVVRVAVVQVHVPSVGGVIRFLRRRPKVARFFRRLFKFLRDWLAFQPKNPSRFYTQRIRRNGLMFGLSLLSKIPLCGTENSKIYRKTILTPGLESCQIRNFGDKKIFRRNAKF